MRDFNSRVLLKNNGILFPNCFLETFVGDKALMEDPEHALQMAPNLL